MKCLLCVVMLAVVLSALGTTQPAFSQTQNDVIINEFIVNPATGKEWVELLVAKVGGIDIRGWRLSDVSTKGGAGSGTEGHLDFPNTAPFSSVPYGTRIVCVFEVPTANSNTFSSEDLDPSDGTMIVFTSALGGVLTASGTIDISTNENLQLLTDGTAGATTIDFVATGTNTSYSNFTDAVWPSNLSGGSGLYYFTNNSGGGLNNDTSTVGWFANQPVGGATPGSLNSGQTLPGAGPSDGSGIATLINAGGGTYNGTTIFSRNTGGQTVTVTITGVSGGTLDQVRLTVPATWSGYSSGNVSLGGAFTSLTPVFAGNDITLNSAALGTTPGTITISSLTSPNPVGGGASGNDQWLVQTAIASGTLTPISSSPRSHTVIPIQNLRTGGTDGFGNSDAGGTIPVLNNTVVAVQGVVTVPNRVLAETTSTSIIIQDGSYGVQVFRSGAQSHTTLLLGNLITVKGNVEAFNGNTEVVPSTVSSPDVINHGASSLPSPQVLLSASAIAESTEARLVTISSVNWDSVGSTFQASGAGTPRNNFKTGATPGTMYLNAVNNIVGTTIPTSTPIIGVVYHRTDQVGGGQQAHKIAPRNLIDLGFDPADGTGTATIAPTGRVANQLAVAETLTVTGNGTHTLGGVSVTIPSSWGWDGSSRTLSGAGFTGASSLVSGDGSGGNPWVITINSAAVTNVNTGVLRIFNLNTPSTTGLTTFITRTRGASGTLANIAVQPTVNIGSAFEAIASGNWSNPATWAGGVVPTASDNVTMTTLGVTVTIDIDGAVCNNLTITGSGSASNSGPVLEFESTGIRSLTVNGNLVVSGGSGGGSGDRGGRPKLWDNGNNTIMLTVKGSITNNSSNTTSNGNAGISMGLGVVRMTGSTQDTIRLGAGMRLAGLEIGDGTDTKTIYTAITATTARLALISLTVKTGSTLWIGTGNNTNVLTIGNTSETGVPVMVGGINIQSGAALRVQESTAGFVQANINLNGGSITNNGTLDLISPAFNFTELTGCYYNMRIGGHPAGSSGGTITVGGSNPGSYANVTIDSAKTLALNRDMELASFAKMTINNGTLAETDGNTVIGRVEATRNVPISTLENFGGMGLEINAAGAAPGSTVATRYTGQAITSGSSQSILRYFDITPTTNSGLNATLNFYYDNSELNGNVAANLQLYKSTNAGATWGAQGGAVNVGLKQIQLTGVASLSRWTAADDLNPLGGFSVPVSTFDGWNMISNPVTTSNDSVSQLFPTAAFTYAFSFSSASGYQQQYRMLNGPGYWEKFAGPQVTSVFGAPRPVDTIAVSVGWNMIGSISSPVATSSITQIPGGIITTDYFSYNPGYSTATTIQPGKGYWVKAGAAGQIVLGTPGPSKPAEPVVNPLDGFSTIVITDSRGFSQTLRIGEDMTGEFPVHRYEMPPQAPEGAFDVRFASGRAVEAYAKQAGGSYPVQLRSVAYPVTVSWELNGTAERSFTLNDGMSEKKISGTGSIVLKQVNGGELVISSKVAEIPVEFSLAQNFPNPFNPATTIRFGLPQESRVTLRVFNLLGQQVAELTGGVLEAGYQEFVWDGKTSLGTSAGSGVYFYKIEAISTADGRTFSEVRKMVLLK